MILGRKGKAVLRARGRHPALPAWSGRGQMMEICLHKVIFIHSQDLFGQQRKPRGRGPGFELHTQPETL